jgi:hypothetical protein
MSFKTLESISAALSTEYPEAQAWANSSFNWIRIQPPASKGAIGRNLASGLLQSYGFTVSTGQYLLRINGLGITVKTSLMWNAGAIKFQNIGNTSFDFVLCLGIYPNKAFGWLIPKSDIWVNGVVRKDRPGVTRQHKGADAWIDVDPDNVQGWLKPYGGSIDALIKVAKTSL